MNAKTPSSLSSGLGRPDDADGSAEVVGSYGPGGSAMALPAPRELMIAPYEDDRVDPEVLRLLNNPKWVNAPPSGLAIFAKGKHPRNLYDLCQSKETVPPLTDMPPGMREFGTGLRFIWRLTDDGRRTMLHRSAWIRRRGPLDSEIIDRKKAFYRHNPEICGPGLHITVPT